MARFNRERVPEWVVRAKGSGAFGYFEANGEAEKYCRADFLKKGRKDPGWLSTGSSADNGPWGILVRAFHRCEYPSGFGVTHGISYFFNVLALLRAPGPGPVRRWEWRSSGWVDLQMYSSIMVLCLLDPGKLVGGEAGRRNLR